MKSHLGKLVLIAVLGLTMLEMTGCATSSEAKHAQHSKMQKARAKQMAKSRGQASKLRDYSLFRKGDVNNRILRRGQKARYSNALDNY